MIGMIVEVVAALQYWVPISRCLACSAYRNMLQDTGIPILLDTDKLSAHKMNVFAKCAALLDDSRSIRHGDEIQKVGEEPPLAIGWSLSESSGQLGPSWSDSSLPIT
jgi:hypothetical protein